MTDLPELFRIVLIGASATALLDAFLLLQARLGLPAGNFGLIGRWVGHMRHGRFVHAAIGKAAPVRGELALGWLAQPARRRRSSRAGKLGR